MSNEKPNRRYLANIVTTQTQYGPFQKALMNNLQPTNQDGSPNNYFRGNLIWVDAITGKQYLVKQMQFQQHQNGKSSLVLDIDSSYHVEEIVTG